MCPAAALLSESSQHPLNDLLSYHIPQDALSQAAYEIATADLPLAILAHSLRVYYYAIILSKREIQSETAWHSQDRLPLLFVACMFHDYGVCSRCDTDQYRFEVEGADAAVEFLKAHGISSVDAQEVWVAIACHTSPHIGERISILGKLVRQGPLLDFHRIAPVLVLDEEPAPGSPLYVLVQDVRSIEELFRRQEIEKVLAGNVVAQAKRDGMRGKAPGGSWPGDIFMSAEANPEWSGINKAF